MKHTLPPEGVDLRFPIDTGCVGCSPTNPAGMHLVFRREGDVVTGRYTVPEQFRGGPGTVHGGILALLLDEYSCAAGYFLTGSLFVTGSLNVRYERPVTIGTELHIRAALTESTHPKYRVIDAQITDGATLLVSSTGRFFPVAPSTSV